MKYRMKIVYRANFDRDKMIKSSAYNREFSFAPFGKTKGSDNVFSNAKGRSSISIKVRRVMTWSAVRLFDKKPI